MVINLFVIVGVMGLFNGTLTLPGIAGFVLTIGMAVDANVLIFERMKEEIRLGKTLGPAIEAGFKRAWSSILDSNVSSIFVAPWLLWQGTTSEPAFALVPSTGATTPMLKPARNAAHHNGGLEAPRIGAATSVKEYFQPAARLAVFDHD